MPKRHARPLFEDMRAYAEEALAFLGECDGDQLAADRMRFLAVARAAEVVGEAASQVPHLVRAAFPEIEFTSAISMRNRLVHGYGSVSAAILTATVRDDFPDLVRALQAALAGALPDEDAAQP
jgi:uncharacterized protein with HEPN domain